MGLIRVCAGVAVSAVMLLLGATAAQADHTHVRVLGNGMCVILAADGGEKYVQLPHADAFAENRRHPLHVNVHLGQPGMRNGEPVVFVKGTAGDLADCEGYVND